jgi:rubrerythrin
MGTLFDVAEVVRVGVEDEKTGVALYTALSARAEDDKLRAMYAELAEQERVHQGRFEQMLEVLGEHAAAETYAGEYAAYLRALMADRAFPSAEAACEAAAKCVGDREALDMAARMERDTLVLMHEMRTLVRDADKPIVDELIIEEQSHVTLLSEAATRLDAQAAP